MDISGTIIHDTVFSTDKSIILNITVRCKVNLCCTWCLRETKWYSCRVGSMWKSVGCYPQTLLAPPVSSTTYMSFCLRRIKHFSFVNLFQFLHGMPNVRLCCAVFEIGWEIRGKYPRLIYVGAFFCRNFKAPFHPGSPLNIAN